MSAYFIRTMSLLPVCSVADLPDGGNRVLTVGRKDVAVFRVGDGYFAIDDMCPHAGASLSAGHVEDGCVTCPWHAWRFRLADGAWADNPRVKTGSYKVVLADGRILLDVPDPTSPNPGGAS